ncbi:MAG: hypothetical protein NXH97_07560 [Rhodobacteraceae bacterium]|nr:hypothetical protein [Paracoccaceae bacterium]
MIDKMRLRDAMLALEEAELAHAREAYEEYLREARIDHSEPVERGDQAQAEAAGELAAALDHPVHDHAEKIARLREIDFGPKSEVSEGALIDLGGKLFVVAVSTIRFTCDGATVMGISPQAPLYRALEGLGAGESAEVNGREVTVDAVA